MNDQERKEIGEMLWSAYLMWDDPHRMEIFHQELMEEVKNAQQVFNEDLLNDTE